jgi:hypothetical protein
VAGPGYVHDLHHGQARQYGRTGLTYRKVSWVVPGAEQSHMREEAGRGEGYYIRRAR